MANFAKMEENLGEASQLLKAMASPNRLMLLCLMADGEKSVSELTAELDLRQATVSQHLARLRQEGLVSTRRDAQTIYYSIADKAAADIIGALHKAFCK
ncbi:Transcriptional regulator, ArsR family [hydrothermal vent metagenome]|uniref:Transcriptional regulator, ArsR family n=1 Tax=hydrothermal vent metagenome TaxID=652676 RepID=A0A3B0S8H5_9ZZZZ